MPTTPAAARAHARFVLLRHLPMLVVDLEPPAASAGGDGPGRAVDAAALGDALTERGLVTLPRFYDVDLPRGVRVGLTVEDDGMRLEDDEETTLLRLPRDGVDDGWLARATELRGSMLCVGSSIGIAPDQTPHEVCDLLDIAATAGRVLGAIVGVAEPRAGLPLLF